MIKRLSVGLILVVSFFLLVPVGSSSEAANTSSTSVNEDIDASRIGFKSVHKIADKPNWSAWGPDKDGFYSNGDLVYSSDGRYLLYAKVLAKPAEDQIVIINVATRKIEKVIKSSARKMASSPDGQRIFLCQGSGFSIYEIKSGKQTDVKTRVSRGRSFLWYDNEKILVSDAPSYEVLDLNSLTFSNISKEEARELFQKFVPNSIGQAHFSCLGGNYECSEIFSQPLQIFNNDGSFGKVLVDSVYKYAVSPKYDSIAFTHSSGLFLAYLDTNFKTEMDYSVDSFSDSLPDDLRSAYTSFMNRNVLLVGEVYAPKINPLTGKVVGIEGESKGKVKIIVESNGKVVLRKIFEKTPFKVGKDVLSNIEAPKHQYIKNGNVRFKLEIWPTLHTISEKELAVAEEDKEKQVENALVVAKDWLKKGESFFNEGDQQGAIDAFSNAIEADPNNEVAYAYRAFVYDRLRQSERAITDLGRAIDLNPNFALAYYVRALVYSQMFGHSQEAMQDWKRAASLGSKEAQEYLRSRRIKW